jgi:[CysO sulfur-carrier protein]-S-L-cysteine hydrolase
MIEIPPALIAQMQDHAFAWYPGECCGLLFAKAGSEVATRAVPMDNLQDKLHATNPVDNPRTSRNGFQMNALKMDRLVDEAERSGERLLGIFHSHIDCAAYFSQEDTDMAAPPPSRQPNDPSLWHVVMECWSDGIRIARAFRWDGRDFAGHELAGFARKPAAPLRTAMPH